MPHIQGHEDSPYGDLFDLPAGTGEIDWDNPSAQDLARIQQDPQLQLQYITSLYTEGMPEAGEEDTLHGWRSGHGQDMSLEQLIGYFGQSESLGDLGWAGMDEDTLRKALEDFRYAEFPDREYTGHIPLMQLDQPGIDKSLKWLLDLSKGMGKLGYGQEESDVGIDVLTRELDLTERGVTGPGGLVGQKGTLQDMLQRKIAGKREAYVPKEKGSRYAGLTGFGGGPDPTQAYTSGIGADISAYGASIGDVDKSIYDILYGTDEGSISDVYGDYGDLVKKSLYGPSGDMWWS